MTVALRAYTILLLMAWTQTVGAQVRPVGVIWQPPTSTTQARAEVELMRQHGIRDVYTTVVPTDDQLQILRNFEIHLLAQQPAYYLTTWYLEGASPRLKAEIMQNWNRLRTYPHLRGYALFFEGALFRPDFISLASELRPSGMPDQLAYYSSDLDLPPGYSLPMSRLGLVQTLDEAQELASSDPDRSYLIHVKPAADQPLGQWYDVLKTRGTGYLYLPAEILFVENAYNSELLSLIKEIQSDPEHLLPVRSGDRARNHDGFSILVYLIILVVFSIHYAFDPTYRKSLQRFYLSNRIFVDDLVQRRAKLTFSNYIVIVYISLLSGTFAMSIAEFKVSLSGIVLLSYFVPYLNSESILLFGFIAGATFSLVILALLIPWGAYMNKGTTHVMSYVTIILWPNHTLFLLVLISIVLARVFNSPHIAALLSMIIIVLPLLSYSYGGLKLIRYSFRSGLPYLILYFIPPFLLLLSFVWWLSTYTPVFQLAELTIRLP